MRRDILTNLLTVFLGSGAAIAVARLVFEQRKERKQRADATKYLAIQLAFQLEGYAIDCAVRVSDHQTSNENQGYAGQLIKEILKPPPLPSSESYQFLEGSILNEIFGFSQQCQMAQEAAMFWWDVVGDEDCCHNALEENTIRMGCEALKIARRIRREHELGDRALEFGQWNDFFDREMKKLAAAEAKRRDEGKNARADD